MNYNATYVTDDVGAVEVVVVARAATSVTSLSEYTTVCNTPEKLPAPPSRDQGHFCVATTSQVTLSFPSRRHPPSRATYTYLLVKLPSRWPHHRDPATVVPEVTLSFTTERYPPQYGQVTLPFHHISSYPLIPVEGYPRLPAGEVTLLLAPLQTPPSRCTLSYPPAPWPVNGGSLTSARTSPPPAYPLVGRTTTSPVTLSSAALQSGTKLPSHSSARQPQLPHLPPAPIPGQLTLSLLAPPLTGPPLPPPHLNLPSRSSGAQLIPPSSSSWPITHHPSPPSTGSSRPVAGTTAQVALPSATQPTVTTAVHAPQPEPQAHQHDMKIPKSNSPTQVRQSYPLVLTNKRSYHWSLPSAGSTPVERRCLNKSRERKFSLSRS